MSATRLGIAKPDIVSWFDALGARTYRRGDLSQILSEKRTFWRLREGETLAGFIEFLLRSTKLKRAEFKFPHRKETRYVWGEVPLFDVVMSIKPEAYLSHFSAMYVHELTEQVPKVVYLNVEQTPKPAPRDGLDQERIDRAFSRPQRVTSNYAEYRGRRIVLLNGKHTNQQGVIDATGPDGSDIRVTGIERTLIDVAVRPEYAGGVHEVAGAYRLAKGRLSTNRLSAVLKKLGYVYPYRQAIGYYLERGGIDSQALLDLFRKEPFEFDFYLCHGMKKKSYLSQWRLFVPDGF